MSARAAIVGVVLLAIAVAAGAAWALSRDDGSTGAAGGGSTLERTLVDRDGDADLEAGPGEPLTDRTDLGAAVGGGRRVALLAQVSDAHVRDEESPARVPVLDRLGDPLGSTFRSHEALSAQTLVATVRAINALRPDAVLETGDLIDNAQGNELASALAALNGGRVDPDSGGRGYDGVQDARNDDPLFYRPDVDAPQHPGILAQAQLPFASPGLDAPWYPALGNHDALLQGEVPASPRLSSFATGDQALRTLPRDAELPSEDELSSVVVERFLDEIAFGNTRRVPPDAARRPLDPQTAAARLRAASDVAAGTSASSPLDYAVDVGPRVRLITLDVVDRAGGADGAIAPAQVAWLEGQIAAAGNRWVIVMTHQPLTATAGGDQALAVLDRSARVLAVVSGHVHRNRIEPRGTPAGGYWLISTASLADFPQQARALAVLETPGGGAAIETWMLDHDGDGLAGTSRELAFIDAQGGRPNGFAGGRGDRNGRLFKPAPGR